MEQFFCPNGKHRWTMARPTEFPVRFKPVSSKFSITSLGFGLSWVNGTAVLLKLCRNSSVSYPKCGPYFDFSGGLILLLRAISPEMPQPAARHCEILPIPKPPGR
jgi:hypothetical protein